LWHRVLRHLQDVLGAGGTEADVAPRSRRWQPLREPVLAELTANHRVRLKSPTKTLPRFGGQRPQRRSVRRLRALLLEQRYEVARRSVRRLRRRCSSNGTKSYTPKVDRIRTPALEPLDVFLAEQRQD
jgi:hypothetical protein